MSNTSPDWNALARDLAARSAQELMSSPEQDITEEEAQDRRQEANTGAGAVPQGPWDVGIAGQQVEVDMNPMTTATTWTGDHLTVNQQPPLYTYHQSHEAVAKETIKQAVREVLTEMAEEDASFTAWLRAKYMTIPVIQRPETKEETHEHRGLPQPIPPSWTGNAGGFSGTSLGQAGLGGVSLRSDVQSRSVGGAEELDSPPDQGSSLDRPI